MTQPLRYVASIGLWVFAMWLGLTAIDHHDGGLLTIYVVVASFALSAVADRLIFHR